VTQQYSYWDRAGLPSSKPNIPFGNLQSIAKKQRSFGTAIYDLYKSSTEPLLGIYLFFRPAILVRDKEIIKNILTKDFVYFHDRGTYVDKKNDPISANLFSLEGEDWKQLRHQLTPAFSSGKIKGMFQSVKFIGSQLVEHIKPLAENEEIIEHREFAGRFVADCLASLVFGLEGVSTIQDPDHEFRQYTKILNSDKSILNVLRRTANFLCPG
jgi:cytochrome P450 family 6